MNDFQFGVSRAEEAHLHLRCAYCHLLAFLLRLTSMSLRQITSLKDDKRKYNIKKQYNIKESL